MANTPRWYSGIVSRLRKFKSCPQPLGVLVKSNKPKQESDTNADPKAATRPHTGTPADEPPVYDLGGLLLSGGGKHARKPVTVFPSSDPYGLENENTTGTDSD